MAADLGIGNGIREFAVLRQLVAGEATWRENLKPHAAATAEPTPIPTARYRDGYIRGLAYQASKHLRILLAAGRTRWRPIAEQLDPKTRTSAAMMACGTLPNEQARWWPSL